MLCKVWRCGALFSLLVVSLLMSPTAGHAQQVAGVQVDAEGVLQTRVFRDPTGQLTRRRLMQAKAALDPNLARPSELRKVSLNRLEAVVAERLAAGRQPTDNMLHLAGLTGIEYVFFYPESGDIVIAGPAEGYAPDLSGRMVGVESGSATLLLEDLVTALRAFPPSGERTGVVSVSIDPTQEGLQRMQQFLARIAGRIGPGDAQRIASGLRESLGKQEVTVRGVSPKTHFAQVLVEADYRMKLIGIGLEQPPVNIPSYVSRANPRDVARNAMQRWYFTPNYESVKVSDDGLGMQLVGQGVKLIGEDELVTAGGGRVRAAGGGNRASKAFTTTFTAQYPKLAAKSPVYAQMKDLIDMLIAAAFIQQQDYYAQAGWTMDVLGSEELLSVETHNAPRQVESAVNVVWKGRTLMTPIGGGVNIQPRLALASDAVIPDTGGDIRQHREQVELQNLAADQWWWD